MKVRPTAKAKRARGENWLDEDKNLLLELIKKRLQILENKNTDTDTNVKKKNAWVAVQQSFNSICRGPPRSVDQLKAQWGHIKILKKKELCAEGMDIFKTGGEGPPQVAPESSEDVKHWLPNEVTVDSNHYDADPLVLTGNGVDIEASSPLSPPQEEPLIELVVEDDFEIMENHGNENPSKRKIPHNKNEIKKRGDFAKEKIKEIAEAEMNFKSELHKAKIANQKRKARNLDLKYQVLKAKLKYYKIKKDKDDD